MANDNTFTTDFDLLPFIETADGSPSFPVSMFALCIISALTCHYIYVTSSDAFAEHKKGVRVVALLHAVWATTASAYVLYKHDDTALLGTPTTICKVLGPTKIIFAVTLGYFLWDVCLCFKENWTIDYKLHAVFSFAVYFIGASTHSMHRWGLVMLFYEFSTIFLHSYILLFYYQWTRIGNAFKVLFALTFFFCRLVVGSVITIEIIDAYFGWSGTINHDCVPSSIFTFVLGTNLLFHALNLYWFGIIVKGAVCSKPERKRKKKNRRRKHHHHESKTKEQEAKETHEYKPIAVQ